MKIGLFCSDKEEISKLKTYALNKLMGSEERVIQIKKTCDYGFDIVTNINEYRIRKAHEGLRGLKLHEVYYHNVTNNRILDVLYFTLIPINWSDEMWDAKEHFIEINQEDLK